MTKLLVVIVVLGAGGFLAWRYLLAPSDARACAKLSELCGVEAKKDCEESLASLRKAATGPEAADATARCVLESESCAKAAGCVAGGVAKAGLGAAREFFDGLQKAIK